MAVPLLIPLISVGLQAAGSIFSFSQAKKSRERQQDAQRDAAKAMAEAKAELEVNTLRGLSIAKEPYELEREALAQAGASALQAGIEGDQRGAGAVAGRVMQASQRALAQQRAAMSTEMADLEKFAATEDARLRAENIVDKSGATLGDLLNADMGVLQIVGQNSNESYSWGGTFNTSSKKKTASITIDLRYSVDN